MNRRRFVQTITAGAGALASAPALMFPHSARAQQERRTAAQGKRELAADVIIVGGGMGGCAAALAALRNGLRVVMTEETDWIGGQLTQQGVPPDEHRWIEQFGATRAYREFRTAIRDYYRRNYPLTAAARARWNLNPGDGSVSRLCHEPQVALAVYYALFAPYLGAGQLRLLLEHQATDADVDGDFVKAVAVRSRRTGNTLVLRAPWFIDATELGDLLPLTRTEYVTGAESRADTGELHAAEKANPHNHQAFTVCFAMDHRPGENHVADKPRDYDFWRDYVPRLTPPWPGKLLDLSYSSPATLQPRALGFNPAGDTPGTLNLWLYRRIAHQGNFTPGLYASDITIVNWPQNDYLLGNLHEVSEPEAARHVEAARQLSAALFYWLQTEVPRADGGQGFPGLRLRGDVLGTEDGLAKYPYVREARRIQPVFRVVEQHVGVANRVEVTGRPADEVFAEDYYDAVGVGSYHIDLHPSTAGDNYIDFASLPFQIPLGALLPRRVENLIPAGKNIGTTHVTNGCYRLHPVEWNIGEAAGALVAFAGRRQLRAREVREKRNQLAEFQNFIRQQGIETHWPKGRFW
ncbi:MAG: FAD-dependent oxidoreductase [Verrucomicrobia bacterium]|nr:FAD-dependent oxidoreductase [Verrucomicrobiota bacterium]